MYEHYGDASEWTTTIRKLDLTIIITPTYCLWDLPDIVT